MGVRRGPGDTHRALKLHIVARGRIGRGPEADLVVRYAQRMSGTLTVTELPEAGGKSPVPIAPMKIIALDETGTVMTSVELAHTLQQWRDTGTREARFLVGAADGLTSAERDSADLFLSFGRATWPHLLVRAMLAEQLYRATSIMAGHPYHREG